MSVVSSDIKQYQATTMPASLATTSVGGAINTGAQITGGTIGEIFFAMGSATTGGGTKTQYAKTFVKNTNGSDNLEQAGIYLVNSLTQVAGNHTVSFASSSASDGATKKVKIIGLNASSAVQQEELALNGTSTVTSVSTWSAIHRVTVHLVSDSTLVAATGTITVTKNATTMGVVPAAYYSATAEVAIWLEGSLNGTTTTTDAATAPGGSSFSAPNTLGSALAVANSQVLTAGASQPVWWRLQIAEGQYPSPDVQIVLRCEGATY